MPDRDADLHVEAGSFEPVYWLLRYPESLGPVDLAAAGFSMSGVIVSAEDGTGVTLATLTDTDFARTTLGKVFFQPASTTSASWSWRLGYGQFTLATPEVGKDVRIWSGRLFNSPAYS